MKWLLIVGCCFIPFFTTMSVAEAITLKQGGSFTRARSKLFAAGWRPDPHAHAGVGKYAGMDRRLMELGFDEVDYCSVGETFCVLQYTRDKTCLRLHTKGEQIEAMKIVSWSDKCREQAVDEPREILPAEIRFTLQRLEDCETSGDCDELDASLRRLKKHYANHPDAIKALRSKGVKNWIVPKRGEN